MTTAGPITTEQWLEINKPWLERIADRDYQAWSWFSPKGTSPTEFICTLIDSLGFAETSQEPWLEISAAQKASCLRFARLLKAYSREHRETLDPRVMLDDPEWEKVRVAAQALVKELYPG